MAVVVLTGYLGLISQGTAMSPLPSGVNRLWEEVESEPASPAFFSLLQDSVLTLSLLGFPATAPLRNDRVSYTYFCSNHSKLSFMWNRALGSKTIWWLWVAFFVFWLQHTIVQSCKIVFLTGVLLNGGNFLLIWQESWNQRFRIFIASITTGNTSSALGNQVSSHLAEYITVYITGMYQQNRKTARKQSSELHFESLSVLKWKIRFYVWQSRYVIHLE